MNYLDYFYQRALAWMIKYGPKIVIALIILLLAQLALRILRKWLKKFLEKSHIDPSIKGFLANLIIVVFQVLLFVTLMGVVGIKMTVFASIIAGFTVAVGLALSGTLQNFASGMLILLLHPYKVGDNIIAQGQEGTVSSIQLFYTVIVTFDNKTVIVPNSKLSNEIILNLSRQGKRRVDIELKFKYANDYDKIKEVITHGIYSMNSVLKDPALRIGVSKLDPDTYAITINTWISAHGFEDGRLLINEKLMAEL
ncbi:MAG: mechanosensitive ion channel family protein, partial [Bacteroidota bacterium]